MLLAQGCVHNIYFMVIMLQIYFTGEYKMTSSNSTKLSIFTYLHNDQPRKIYGQRIDNTTLIIFGKIHLKHDIRDERALVVFDGDIPCNGLPRNSTQIDVLGSRKVFVNKSHIRKPKRYELEHPLGECMNDDNKDFFWLQRRVLLLPAGRATVIRYRPDSLAVCYSTITVRYENNDVSVVF